jgi:hypothetical protein
MALRNIEQEVGIGEGLQLIDPLARRGQLRTKLADGRPVALARLH